MFSDSDQSSKNGNADLDFEALLSTSQYIDISKLDDFITDEISEGKLLALELNMRSLVNNAHFSKLEALLSFMTYKPDIISISRNLDNSSKLRCFLKSTRLQVCSQL